MSTTLQNTPSVSYQPDSQCSTPVNARLPTSEDGTELHQKMDELTVSIEGGLANMSNTLEQIFDVLRGSSIVERSKDVDSNFWETYKKVSTEYDDDFLARANDDMGIILTFAGLFSAVNSAFIVGMQPNPGDTTNALLLHLILITAGGPNAVQDVSSLSSSTNFSSATVWMQALGYASLASSVLAAFGAVLGKQWLNSYKASRRHGSLEERCIERQIKLDGIECFHLRTILQAFLILLQISLLLFGLSLSANMWTEQTTISSVIICFTTVGILLYGLTIFVSVWRPDSPFQTPGSELARTFCKAFISVRSTLNPHIFSGSSAVSWVLETSTNPEVVEAAAAMVPLVQWSPVLDASAAYARLRDNFWACRDTEELFVQCGKAMAHLCSLLVKINPVLLQKPWATLYCWGGRSRFIRDAFIDGRLAFARLQNEQHDYARRKHKADTRTALRTLVVHGLHDRLSLPDDEELIWDGDLRWRHGDGLMPSCEEFDWLVDYLVDEAGKKADDKTEADALLTLSAMCGLGSSTKRRSYIKALIRCMGCTRLPRVRHAALRAVSDARGDLASITNESISHDVDTELLDGLSRALFTAVCPSRNRTIQHERDAPFHQHRDNCYFRLIFALSNNHEWRQRLTLDGHFERCISLVDEALECESWTLGCYLVGIFACIDLSDKVLRFSYTQEKYQALIKKSWRRAREFMWQHSEYVGALPALVMATRQNYSDSDHIVPSNELKEIARNVDQCLAQLKQRRAILVNGQADSCFDAALSSVQGLHDDVRYMIDHSHISQGYYQESFGTLHQSP